MFVLCCVVYLVGILFHVVGRNPFEEIDVILRMEPLHLMIAAEFWFVDFHFAVQSVGQQ